MFLSLGLYAGRHDSAVGREAVREGEEPWAGDVVLLQVDAVDGQEIRVEVVQVVKDPSDLLDAFCQRSGPGQSAFPSLTSAFPNAERCGLETFFAFAVPAPSWTAV